MAVFLITAVALPLLLTEFGDWCPWLAARLVRWAARRLGDPASCKRYEEEWIANLNEVPGKLARLVAAFGYLAYTPRMRRSVRRRMTRSPSPALPAPIALPPVVGGFVGRVRELDALRQLLRTAAESGPDRQLICVVGMGGVGKTALALFCAHQAKEVFPDGQLFVSAGNHSGMGGCLDELLMKLGVPASMIPPGQADKSALFRARVSGRRVLVVLDDIDEPDQVGALFRGDLPCPVLITSRRSPGHSPPAGILTLRGLNNDEAHELLRSRLGCRIDAEAEDAARLLEILDGLPLAITVAAATLACDPSSTIAGLLLKLDMVMNGNGLGRDVRTALDATYNRLSPEQRALLSRLSLLSGAPFGKHEAALLISITPGHADHLIHGLTQAGFLTSTAGEGNRYVLHDLIRAYARECLQRDETPERIQALRDRLTRHGLDPPHP